MAQHRRHRRSTKRIQTRYASKTHTHASEIATGRDGERKRGEQLSEISENAIYIKLLTTHTLAIALALAASAAL